MYFWDALIQQTCTCITSKNIVQGDVADVLAKQITSVCSNAWKPWWLLAVVLFQPEYRLGRPENDLFSLSNLKKNLDQSIQNKISFIWKTEALTVSKHARSRSLLWLSSPESRKIRKLHSELVQLYSQLNTFGGDLTTYQAVVCEFGEISVGSPWN